MDTSRYTFRVDYSKGLEISVYDLENPETMFLVRVFIKKTKIQSQLKWGYSSSGGKWIEEEFINAEEFQIGWGESHLKSDQYYGYFYKGFAPYYVQIFDISRNNELVFEDTFDVRHKLVNFTLNSDNPETLHTWMCVIDKFKKENECQISIKNDYLKQNQKYSFVDCYWDMEEEFERYYAGYTIDRFETENAPDFFQNPDGLQGKNDLDIIEDILYHYPKKL